MSQAKALVLIEEFEPVVNETNATTGIIQTHPVTGEQFESKVFRVDLSNTLDFLVRGVTRLVAIVAEGFESGGVTGGDIPCATILDWAGAPEEIPEGWLLCDGESISKTEYPGLWTILGERYGTGAPAGEFFKPHLMNGRVAKGGNPNGGGNPGNVYSMSLSQLPAHGHFRPPSDHAHGVADGGHNHAITDNGHTHTDAGHQHTIQLDEGVLVNQSQAHGYGALPADTAETTQSFADIQSSTTGISQADFNNSGLTIQNATLFGDSSQDTGEGNQFPTEDWWVGVTKMIKAC